MSFRNFVDNPVKIGMFFVGLLLMGLLSYQRLPMNLFPDLRTPRITLVATTVGMPPEQTERLLTADLERQLSSLKGLASITSFSREQNIVVHVDFHWGADMEFAYLDVKKAVSTFEVRDEIDKIEVYRFDPNAAPLITLAFGGEIDRVVTTNLIENSLKPKLETIEGVAYVKANGVRFQEIEVQIDEDVMGQYELTAEQVLQAIQNYNIATTGGVVTQGNREMVLKFVSRFRTVDEVAGCVIKMIDDHPIRLSDLGQIVVKGTRDDLLVRQDGGESISLDVFKESDANAVFTARRVRQFVDQLNHRGGMELKVAVDQSVEIESAIGEVVNTALIGMALATVILLIFLRNFWATVIVGLAIPLSIVGTFNLMYAQGLSLNIMTLGGLALGAGMLVDNGIVVIENIFSHRQRGMDSRQAAEVGTREVAMAITAATLTTIVVFVPLVYVHGIAGILFKDQAMTVVYSLLVSLLVALGLLPMLAARLGKANIHEPGAVNRIYGSFLNVTLKGRWLLALLFVLGLVFSAKLLERVPSEFFPQTVNGRLTMSMEMPPGTPLEQTEDVVRRMELSVLALRYREADLVPVLEAWESYRLTGLAEPFHTALTLALPDLMSKAESKPRVEEIAHALQAWRVAPVEERPEVERELTELLRDEVQIQSVTSRIGHDPDSLEAAQDRIFGSHTAEMDIVINPFILRELQAEDLVEYLRSQAQTVPGLSISFESRNEFLRDILGSNRGDIVVEVHADDIYTLIDSSEAAITELIRQPGLTNIRTNLLLGESSYVLVPDQDALQRTGVSVEQLARQVQAYLEGDKSDKLRLDQGDLAITIHNPRAEREGLLGLMNLQILADQQRNGIQLREKLRDLVRLEERRGPLEIMRVNQEKTLLVMMDLQEVNFEEGVAQTTAALDSAAWPRGSTWNFSGEEIKRRESFEKLFFALIIALILVYMVIASILESLVHPITIMISVPFAVTGVAMAFYATGISLNIMGYIGIVMLIGIVVNNAIVLLDRAQQLRAEGLAAREAMIEASRNRLRPILMTSLTTILALVPLAMGFGNGAELRRPMAIAVIGGLASSTLLTLWILPGLYLCMEDVMNGLREMLRPFKRQPRGVEAKPARSDA